MRFHTICSIAAISVVLFGLAGTAEAQNRDIRYTYVELDYAGLDISGDAFDQTGLDIEGDGYRLGASVGIGSNFYAFGDWNDLSIDDTSADVEQWSLGVGARGAISDWSDIIAEFGFLDTKLKDSSSGGSSVSDDGIFIALGVRSLPSDNVEMNFKVTYDDLSERFAGDGAFLYHIGSLFAFRIGVVTDLDITQYTLGVRLSFGSR